MNQKYQPIERDAVAEKVAERSSGVSVQRRAVSAVRTRHMHQAARSFFAPSCSSVQMKRRGEEESAHVHDAAREGISDAGSALPFLDQLQAAFGHHDITGVQSHTGSKAAKATRDMGAHAYATGNHVVFGGTPDLHTAAHEAAHIVQQRAGVQLKSGVGEVGDPYERHADAVADAVVQGKSAQDLLDTYAGG